MVCCIGLLSCGGDPPRAPGGSPFSLSLAGSASVKLHPGETRPLHVILTEDQVGPVAGARIHFRFQEGEAADGRLDAADAVTDGAGVAAVQITAGPDPGGAPFHLVASAADLDAGSAGFTLEVVGTRRLLQIVPTSATRVATDGTSANTVAGVSSSIALRVRELDVETGNPVASDAIAFSLPPAASAKWSGTTSRTATAVTGPGGEAQVFLVTARGAEGPWQAVAQSLAGGSAVTFNVTVQGAGSATCTSNGQCGPGQVCAGSPPHCQDGGGADPPPDSGCDVAACGEDQCCDGSSGVCRDSCPQTCAPGFHCQAGPVCGGGACVLDDDAPDLTGLWLTAHDFDIQETLPEAALDLFQAVRLMDQTLLGKLTIPGLPGWVQSIVNSFLGRLLRQYLPGWFQLLVHLSDDFATVLSHLRSEGSMRLRRGDDALHLRGTETWNSLVFYWLPLCDGQIRGDPASPPECARVDLTTTDSPDFPTWAPQCNGHLLPSISPRVSPFTATLVRAETGWTLRFDQRQARVRMDELMPVLVNALFALTTSGQYQCVEEATDCRGGNPCMVDCAGLAQDISTATDGIVGVGLAEPICQRAVTGVGVAVTAAMAKAWPPVDSDLLDFGGSAAIDGDALDGTWTGDFFFKQIHPLPGSFHASRVP
ncbi:MAG TPA: hypothetical protein VFE90_22490 [Myxococcales bacterium]|nr:hypothetical protein [Myxococcales bacterium]